MNPFNLFAWIIRLASGERLRKATPEDNRYWVAVCSLIPAAIGMLMLSHHYWLSLSTISLIVSFILATAIGTLILHLWQKRLPTKVSVVFAAISWTILISAVLYTQRAALFSN